LDELADRNAFLLGLDITAIWFEKNRFETIDNLIRLAKNELRYRSATELTSPPVETTDNQDANEPEIELSHFLRDFNDLLSLMYWLHPLFHKAKPVNTCTQCKKYFMRGHFLLKILISIYWNAWIISYG
jgi:hypothetical protein